MKWLLALIAIFAFTASAADVAGTWKANVDTPNGAMEISFVFKVDAGKLTGTLNGPGGEAPISEATLEGNKIAFAVVRDFNGNEFKLNYKGTFDDKEMKLTLSFPGADQTFDFVAKKVS